MNYRELMVWQKAHQVTLWVYRETRSWPKEELYGLTSQVRRAAVSVEAGTSGERRETRGDSRSSVSRLSSLASRLGSCELLVARDLEYMPPEVHRELEAVIDEVIRMLTALASKLSPLASRLSPAALEDR